MRGFVGRKLDESRERFNIHEMKLTHAGVAKPGQRRQTQDLVPKGFEGSNPFPRTTV